MAVKIPIHVGVLLAIGMGVTALFGRRAWRALTQPALRWEDVGTLGQLIIYPLKSARGISVTSATATSHGLGRGDLLQDRSFMVIREDGSFVSGRHTGLLITVEVTLEGHDLTLQVRDSEVKVDLETVLARSNVMEARMWGQNVCGLDCGDEVAHWLTKHLFADETRVRLLYKGKVMEQRTSTSPPAFRFPQFSGKDRMYYADTSAYLVTSRSSLDDLNSRLVEPAKMEQFRPNLVVHCTSAFDEDDWAFLRIGKVVFRRLKPCERCIQTTINVESGTCHAEGEPITTLKTCIQTTINVESGARHPEGEPITTLKTYRVPKEPESLAKLWKHKPIFGVNMAPETTGVLQTGDTVQVARISAHPWFKTI